MRDRMASAETAMAMSLQANNTHNNNFNSPYLSASADNKHYFNGGGSAAVSMGKYNFSALELSSASAPDQDMSAASSS